MSRAWSCFIGFEPREATAFFVARHSIERRLTLPVPIYGVVLDDLRRRGIYRRPTETRINSEGRPQIWDEISGAPCATEFSISRFAVPMLVQRGLALFMDCDFLVRENLCRLFQWIQTQESKAVWCVKHNHQPREMVKMDGQIQTRYARKNWSSFCVWDADHPANRRLTLDMVNTLPGRDLHAFCWLKDDEIGELDPAWNWLANHSDPSIDPKCVHHTDGSPAMPGFENAPYAAEWRAELEHLAQPFR